MSKAADISNPWTRSVQPDSQEATKKRIGDHTQHADDNSPLVVNTKHRFKTVCHQPPDQSWYKRGKIPG